MRITELFAAFGTSWPTDTIDTSFPPSTDGAGLAAQAEDALEVTDVLTAVGADGTVTVTGTLGLRTLMPPAPTRLVTRLFPSLGFTFAPEPDWTSAFRVSVSPAGATTLQIDSLASRRCTASRLAARTPGRDQAG